MLNALATFVATLTGKAVLTTAMVATGVGGLHASGAFEVPLLPHPSGPSGVENPEDADEREEETDDATHGEDEAASTLVELGGPSDVEELDVIDVDPSDGLDSDELDALCASAENHGQYVSQVARAGAAVDSDTSYENHGEFVREAAHRVDCGDGVVPDREAPTRENLDDTDAESGGGKPDKTGPPAHSNAGGKGRGQRNGG